MTTADTDTESRFAGTATILASAYNVIVRNPGMMPTIFSGRPFADACRDFSRVRLLFQHDQDSPIGVINALWETDEGLWAKVSFSRTPKGEEIAQLCRDRALCEASIGFNVKASATAKREGVGMVRVVSRAELADVSVVTWGANPEAKITEAANRGGTMEHLTTSDVWRTISEAEQWLDGNSNTKSRSKSDPHFDWIRNRELTHEEHQAQQQSAFMMKLHRAIQRDPSIAKLSVEALTAYVEAIG